MDFENKVTVLNLISRNKNVLFGKCDSNLTIDMKVQKWKEIAQQLHEMDIFHKDWKYLRDTTWQNWRKRAIEKRNNLQEGGKKGKLDVADNIIINMLGKNTDVNDSDAPEPPESKYSIELQTRRGNMHNMTNNKHNMTDNMHNSSNISNNSTKQDANYANNMYVKSMNRLRKEKMEADITLTKHKIEIAKREKYKLDLELLKLEKELNIRKISSFTLPYYAAEKNIVLLPENVGQPFLAETEDPMKL